MELPEEAALEERRQRSDKISKLMGAYLLKRYKMLSETCPVCKNILLQSPQGVKYCVNCEETEKETTVTSSHPQDYPVAVPAAASHQAATSMNYEQVECVLLTKLRAAVSTLQDTNTSEVIIHQCHVIKACSEAILAVRTLKDAPT